MKQKQGPKYHHPPLTGSAERRQRGLEAEERARLYLEGHGLKTLATQFRAAGGEIDLVMAHGDITVFVEVRLRRYSSQFGGALGSISRTKRNRIQRAASCWLIARPSSSRFDVVAIEGDELNWVPNAFSAIA